MAICKDCKYLTKSEYGNHLYCINKSKFILSHSEACEHFKVKDDEKSNWLREKAELIAEIERLKHENNMYREAENDWINQL